MARTKIEEIEALRAKYSKSSTEKKSTSNIQRKSIPTSKLRNAVMRWDRMTDNNNHSEVRVSMSKFFGYDDLNKEYKSILNEHRKVGYLSYELYSKRSALDEKLRKRIKKDYGGGVLRMLNM